MSQLVAKLQSMSFEELSTYLRGLEQVNMEDKRRAWDIMDTGVYSEDGALIEDRCEKEDEYCGGS